MQYAMFKYYKPLINNEQVPDTYNYTQLFGLWKGKGSELDLNMMRYIHGNDWEAKLIEALMAGRIKQKINGAIPEIQIGGKASHANIEHIWTPVTNKNMDAKHGG